MNAAYKTILKATTLFGGVQGFNILINLVRTKAVALLLGPAGVGLNSIYNETRELVHSTTNFGLDVSGIKDISTKYNSLCDAKTEEERISIKAELEESICVLRSWILLLALFGTILTVILATPLSYLTFQNDEHTWAYIMLSPVVGLSTIACGETSILKGLRKLKDLASLSVITAVTTTVISISIYYALGIKGVIPALIAIYCATVIVACCYSYRQFKPRFSLQKTVMKAGIPMIKVGCAFMVTNLIDNTIQLVTQSGLNNIGTLDVVGLYTANNTITSTYIGIFIASLSSDYFPRLAGLFNNKAERLKTVCSQAEFLVIVLPPAIAALLFALPFIVPLLLSSEFTEVIPLAQIALVAMIFRITHLPFTYTSLAAGDSVTYFVLSTIQAVDMLLVLPGYYYFGLMGIGYALLITNFIDFVASLMCAKYKYGITMSKRLRALFMVHAALLGICYYCVNNFSGYSYWGVAAVVVAVISLASYKFSRHE